MYVRTYIHNMYGATHCGNIFPNGFVDIILHGVNKNSSSQQQSWEWIGGSTLPQAQLDLAKQNTYATWQSFRGLGGCGKNSIVV